MILCVGERCNAPHLRPGEEREWEAIYDRHGVRAILSTPAMTIGPTRKRLLRAYDLDPNVRVVNLLSPHRTCGSWDAELAKDRARMLVSHLAQTPLEGHPADMAGKRDGVEMVLLLGHRVAAAFRSDGWFKDQSWGSHHLLYYGIDNMATECVLAPHPSGRSTALNDGQIATIVRCVIKSRLEARRQARPGYSF